MTTTQKKIKILTNTLVLIFVFSILSCSNPKPSGKCIYVENKIDEFTGKKQIVLEGEDIIKFNPDGYKSKSEFNDYYIE